MARGSSYVLILATAAVIAVYLFATAPVPLADERSAEGSPVSVQLLFQLCSAENAGARKLFTEQIVATGSKQGLKFDENWHDPGVQAGPLPALFLRETARNLEKIDPRFARLGLYLGSDYPIQQSNHFTGTSAQAFEQLRKDRAPRYFYMADVKLHVAMFPDVAIAQACVDCHNKHPDSPKNDWQLGDVMGATTWTYPAASLPTTEALRVVAALRSSIAAAYSTYLDKARTFSPPPEIGEQWPTAGYALPTTEIFMDVLEQRTSKGTLARLLAQR